MLSEFDINDKYQQEQDDEQKEDDDEADDEIDTEEKTSLDIFPSHFIDDLSRVDLSPQIKAIARMRFSIEFFKKAA